MTSFARIRDLAKQEERLRWAVERQTAKCTRSTTTYSDGPKGGGSGQRMEEDVVRLVMLKEQHAAIEAELEAERAYLGGYVRQLKDGTPRTAMTMRYMNNMRIVEIGDIMGYSERQVFRLLQRAESIIIQRQKAREGRKKDVSACQ